MLTDPTLLRTAGTLVINPPPGEARFNQANVSVLESATDKPQSPRQPQQDSILRRGNSESYAQADTFRQQTQFSESASPPKQSAVNAYQSLAFESRRDEIKQMMGVDTYA